MRLLALDTSTDACSAAVYTDGAVHERFELAPRRHARLILPMAHELLRASGLTLSDLDALAFGAGPGSFTGVRIASAVVQGLALGARLPVIAVSSLAAVGQAASDAQRRPGIAVALDARMGEVYFALYRRGDRGWVRLEGEERVCAPDAVPAPAVGEWFGAGTGWRVYGAALSKRLSPTVVAVDAEIYPRAAQIVRLAAHRFEHGRELTPAQAVPNYVRDSVVQARPHRHRHVP